MSGLILNLLMNAMVSLLLITTITYCWVLSKRIRVLQDSKSELAKLIVHFDESTKRASESVVALQTASKKIGESMQARIDKASYLADDLSMLLEKGARMADRLETTYAAQRGREKIVAVAPSSLSRPADAMRADKLVRSAAGQDNRDQKPEEGIEAMLERIGSHVNAAEARGEKPLPTLRARLRTPAEQELLDAINNKI